MAQSPLIRIGIDIGFGDVKIITGKINTTSGPEKHEKYPLALARITNRSIEGLNDAQLEYAFENRRYLLGSDAMVSRNIIPTRDIDFLLEFSPLLVFRALEFAAQAFHLPLQTVCTSAEICLGLPLAYYKAKKNDLAYRLKYFEVSGYQINIPSPAIQAQGQGILLDFLFDDQSRPNREWIGSNLLILDIGFNTVDILCVHEGRSSAEWSNMLEGAGICRICRGLDIALKRMGLEFSEQAVKKVLSRQKTTLYGEEIDLSDTIKDLQVDYADYLYREIRSRFSDILKTTRKLIVAGGGAYYVSDVFKEKYPDDFLLIPYQPEFSNARGYFKYLKGIHNA